MPAEMDEEAEGLVEEGTSEEVSFTSCGNDSKMPTEEAHRRHVPVKLARHSHDAQGLDRQLDVRVVMDTVEYYCEKHKKQAYKSNMTVDCTLNRQRLIANIPTLTEVILVYSQLMNALGSAEDI